MNFELDRDHVKFTMEKDGVKLEKVINLTFPIIDTNIRHDIDNFIRIINKDHNGFCSICFVDRINGYFSIVAVKKYFKICFACDGETNIFTKDRNNETRDGIIKKLMFIKNNFRY